MQKKTILKKFSKKTLEFLVKAGKQKSPNWLEKNKKEYETFVREPFIELAEKVKLTLKPIAYDYHFPSSGLARIKRPDFKVRGGQNQYKDWISMIASRPTSSRFESNPHLFFGLFPNEEDKIIIAGGLWQPNSKQIRLVREAINQDSEPFHKLFRDKNFKARFKTDFHQSLISPRTPRGFSENHKDIDWIKLKRFVVYKVVSIKEFSSPDFANYVIEDFKQALRLNNLLDQALKAKWPPK